MPVTKHPGWYAFLVLVCMQGIFCAPGACAEPSRTLAVTANQDRGIRVALVIGNSRYPSGALANPKNDATAMAAQLKKLGFDVDLKLDASKADMDAMLRRFSGKAEKAMVAALFYAGHGIQVNGSNYLVPIDANPRNERDLKRDMVRMDDVIDDMGDAKVKLVFFDACRDNPLSRSFTRGGSRGMAAPVEATGTLISFATKHGNTAADGGGTHSPYTSALLAALESPNGVEIEQMLRRVQQRVKLSTSGQQEPWRYGSLDGDFYFKATEAQMDASRAQQEVVDMAVSAAVRQANEQAAREKAELRQAMEKMLKEALDRQTVALDAERAARLAASGEPATARPSAIPPAQAPIQLASLAQTDAGGSQKPLEHVMENLSAATGEEWEYLANDELFGKKQKLVLRTKAASAKGVLEEIIWNGKPAFQWVFGERAAALGTPNESEFMFAPHWKGGEISNVMVEGGKGICTSPGVSCLLSLKIAGNEKLTVAAGTFDAIRLEGWMTVLGSPITSSDRRTPVGPVTIWYSKDQRRLLKQSVSVSGPRINYRETLELSAIRPALR